MLKSILKTILPGKFYLLILRIKRRVSKEIQLKQAYKYDFIRNRNYSEFIGQVNAQQLIGLIIREYHVIEKGLTMPETRLGFGKDLLIDLVKNCLLYVNSYGVDEDQLEHAVSVVLEYEQFHLINNFNLSDEVKESIVNLKSCFNYITPSSQIEVTSEEYFSSSNSNFLQFSSSRSSVRNFSEEDVDIRLIKQALEIARSTPSACNRQPWRTYIFDSKSRIVSILEVQGGNRGFGHLTNKLIVVTVELGMYASVEERNGAYVDGGMYAMNLLYALHYGQVAACILNCSNSVEKDIKMRELCGVKESEVFIAMISCGIPPQKFKVAKSLRYPIEVTNSFVS